MKKIYIFLSLILFTLFISCEKENDTYQTNPVYKDKVSGFVQKGPYNNGTAITISELYADLTPTGKNFNSQIVDNKGTFEFKNIELSSQFVELKANGFYFNEIIGENSSAQLTLFALTDLSDSSSININILSNIEKSRVEYLISEGVSFANAKKQAQQEILGIFSISQSDIISSEFLDITKAGDDNAILLAVSLILQGHRSVSELSELLANISTDIREDGELNSTSIGTSLINHAKYLNVETIRNNLESRYNDLGVSTIIPEFENYIKLFLDSTNYVFANFIDYPNVSDYGINILSDNDSVFDAYQMDKYSMSAEVPNGASLKIVLKLVSGTAPEGGFWAYHAAPNGPINWKITSYDFANNSQEFEIIESGEKSDLKIIFHADSEVKIDIEYYENTNDLPTKTRRIKINN